MTNDISPARVQRLTIEASRALAQSRSSKGMSFWSLFFRERLIEYKLENGRLAAVVYCAVPPPSSANIAPDRKEQCNLWNLIPSQKPAASTRHSCAQKSWGPTPSSSVKSCFAMQISPAEPASATLDRALASPAPCSLASTGLAPTPSIYGAIPSRIECSSIRSASHATQFTPCKQMLRRVCHLSMTFSMRS